MIQVLPRGSVKNRFHIFIPKYFLTLADHKWDELLGDSELPHLERDFGKVQADTLRIVLLSSFVFNQRGVFTFKFSFSS